MVPVVLAACGGSSPTLDAIEVTPAGASLAKGTSLQLAVVGRFSDGVRSDVTDQATWASAAPDVAAVSSAGMVSGLAVGASEVTATVGR